MEKYTKLKRRLEKFIAKYINSNSYLLTTDDFYTINCHLKPRLVANAVEDGCSRCRKKEAFDDREEEFFQDLFSHCTVFAVNYVNSMQKKGCDMNKNRIT